MTEASDIRQRRPFARIGAFLSERRGLLRDYFAAISGAGGRLVFSLLYFVALANTLSLADFGLFATASAAGVMLSRILALGFISALYRTATIRPNLIGTFTAGFFLMRAVGAVAFALWPTDSLAAWSGFYIAVNAIALIVAVTLFYPRQRLRFRPLLYWRRLADSLYVAGAEILFYLQMEFDKLLVLAIGGPQLTGLYAIVMRLVDLTAIPIRTFSMMLVQRMMRTPDMLKSWRIRGGIEAGIFAVSTGTLLSLAVVLHFFPTALGRTVAEAAPLVGLAVFVPGLRNLVEYQAELLFARGQTLVRALNLAVLAGAKAVLLIFVMISSLDTAVFIWSLNAMFATLYLVSSLLTYSALR